VLCPAVDIKYPVDDLLYAVLDDLAPTAIEERDESVRAFFASPAVRDAAIASLSSQFDVAPVDVPDEDWARRSQEGLKPVTVGRITIAAPDAVHELARSSSGSGSLIVVISPSMGFGTGHHATTRLCLAAMQQLDVSGRSVVDAGTGSGILALAAARLGARRAIGFDCDPDAIESARENLDLNRDIAGVTFEVADVMSGGIPRADIVTANLTGALLMRSAGTLLDLTTPGGALVLSGLTPLERNEVRRAFASANVLWERDEDDWVGLVVKKS
jgi:ribosomal protein L11 methyltransferase